MQEKEGCEVSEELHDCAFRHALLWWASQWRWDGLSMWNALGRRNVFKGVYGGKKLRSGTIGCYDIIKVNLQEIWRHDTESISLAQKRDMQGKLDVTILLKWILRKYDGMTLRALIWLRRGICSSLLCAQLRNCRRIPCLTEKLSASKGGHCVMRGKNLPEREADHSLPPSGQFKNEFSSPPFLPFVFMK